MTRKVRVDDNGGTDMLTGSLVEVLEFEDKNNEEIARAAAEGREPELATGNTVLLGITNTEMGWTTYVIDLNGAPLE